VSEGAEATSSVDTQAGAVEQGFLEATPEGLSKVSGDRWRWLVSDALLAVRLFADSLEPGAIVYQGQAAMDIERAFAILTEDSLRTSPITEGSQQASPIVAPLTRFRIATAIVNGIARRVAPLVACLAIDWNKVALAPDLEVDAIDDRCGLSLSDGRGLVTDILKAWAELLPAPGWSPDVPATDPPRVLAATASVDDLIGRITNDETLLEQLKSVECDAVKAEISGKLVRLATSLLLQKGRVWMARGTGLGDQSIRLKRDFALLDLATGLMAAEVDGRRPGVTEYEKGLYDVRPTIGDSSLFGFKFPELMRLTWKTSTQVDWRGRLSVSGQMTLADEAGQTSGVDERIGVIYDIFANLCDPLSWSASSGFWIRSGRCKEDGSPYEEEDEDGTAYQQPHAEAVDKPHANGKIFFINEVVRGVTRYDVVLGVTYERELASPNEGQLATGTGNRCTLVRYFLVDGRKTDLVKDEGYIRITLERSEDGNNITGEYVKILDFADNPYGGPGSTDLVAPSYIGSWVRVQLDLWASAAEQRVRDRR